MVKGWLVSLMAGALLSACQAHEVAPTQLMLAASSDLPAEDFQYIVFEITERDGKLKTTKPQALPAGRPVDLTVALLHTGGSKLGPVTVSALGLLHDGRTHRRTHEVSFERGRTLMVPLHLMNRCFEGAECKDGKECSELGCTPRDLENLAPWTGDMPVFPGADGGAATDAASPETDASEPPPPPPVDAGQGEDAGPGPVEDAGTPIMCDENSDLTQDEHCGSCDNDCTAMSNEALHAKFICVNMACKPRCQDHWRNCDGRLVTGCETDVLTDRKNCGVCDNKCTGNRACVDGVCQP